MKFEIEILNFDLMVSHFSVNKTLLINFEGKSISGSILEFKNRNYVSQCVKW
jgi:hypothetical protein